MEVNVEFMIRTPKNVYVVDEAKAEIAALQTALANIAQKELYIQAGIEGEPLPPDE